MECHRIRAISAQTDQTPADAREVAEHLADCPACMDELGELPMAFAAPNSAIPPPNLVGNIMARLPAATPAQAAVVEQTHRRYRWTAWGVVSALVVTLMVVGMLGVIVDSSLPASLLGGIDSALGRLVLALTLLGKPIIGAFGSLGLPFLLSASLLLAAGSWAWRQLVGSPPAAVFAEVERSETHR